MTRSGNTPAWSTVRARFWKDEARQIPDSEGRLAGSYVYGASYNLDGTMQGTGYPAAGGLPAEAVSYSYDPLKRLTAVGGSLSSYVTANRYTGIGQLQQMELSAGGSVVNQTFSYEPGTRRLAEAEVGTVGLPGADRDAHYSYDDAGNITAISDVSRVGTDTQCFGYDYLARLTQAWTQNTQACAEAPSADVVGGPAPYWQTFAYDLTGDRTQEVDHGLAGQADTTRTYTYPTPGEPHPHALTSVTQTGGAGNRTDSFAYDAAGNTTTRTLGTTSQQLTWDAEGHLASVTEGGQTTSFLYDADGNRLIRRDPTGTTLFLPGQELRLDTATGQVTGTRYYTDGPTGPVIAVRTPDGLQWLAADAQGTALLAIDAVTLAETRRWFTPFGQPRGTTPPTWPGGEHGFINGVLDPSTGLTHLGAREYDTATGRFISPDPLLDVSDPQQMNGYSYANNTPVTASDPTGTIVWGGTNSHGQQYLAVPKQHGGGLRPEPMAHSAASHQDRSPKHRGGGGPHSGVIPGHGAGSAHINTTAWKRYGGTVYRDVKGQVTGLIALGRQLYGCAATGGMACQQLHEQFGTAQGWKATGLAVIEPFRRDCATAETRPECAAHITVAILELAIGGKGATKLSKAGAANAGSRVWTVDALSSSGSRLVGKDMTRAGQELAKHAGQGSFPVPKGSPSVISRMGQQQLDDILTARGTRIEDITKGNFAGGKYYIAPDGRGAAFDSSGVFQYFGLFKP